MPGDGKGKEKRSRTERSATRFCYVEGARRHHQVWGKSPISDTKAENKTRERFICVEIVGRALTIQIVWRFVEWKFLEYGEES